MNIYFINKNVLNLTNKLDDTKIIKYTDFNQLSQIIYELENNIKQNVSLYCDDIDYVFNEICKIYTKIDAAGGIVINEKNEILIIERLGKYDLPKGKVEINENIADTAIREIKEETGLQKVELIKFYANTFHTYVLNNKKVIKQTHWYLTKADSNQKLIPQQIEDITTVEWLPENKINKVYANSYPSIIELLKSYFKK